MSDNSESEVYASPMAEDMPLAQHIDMVKKSAKKSAAKKDVKSAAKKAVKSAAKVDGRSRRAEIIKKVMAEQGLKMIAASQYVKAHNLY